MPKNADPIAYIKSKSTQDILKELRDMGRAPSDSSEPEKVPEPPQKKPKTPPEATPESAQSIPHYALRSQKHSPNAPPLEPVERPVKSPPLPASMSVPVPVRRHDNRNEEEKHNPAIDRPPNPSLSGPQLAIMGESLSRIGIELNTVAQHVEAALHSRPSPQLPSCWQTLQTHAMTLQRLSNDVYGLHRNVSYMNQINLCSMQIMPSANPNYLPNYLYADMNQNMPYPEQNGY